MTERPLTPPPPVPSVAVDNPIPFTWAEETERAAQAAAAEQGVELHEGVDPERACKIVDTEDRYGKPSRRECSGCGAKMKADDVPHREVARVVRPGFKYGPEMSKGGTLVYIEDGQLHGPAAEASMSLVEWRAIQYKRLADAEAARVPKPNRLAEMINLGFEAMSKATRAEIERARGRIRHEADLRAEEARTLAPDHEHRPASDHEGPHESTRPVAGSES